MGTVKIVECPRDAMQGLHDFIPTEKKISYIQSLLQVGFHTIDFGSFVSPKAIPQMRDTAQVLAGLELDDTSSKLLAIVANLRGAQEAASHPQISYLGFPFSLSETFQQRNTNTSIGAAFETVKQLLELCAKTDKKLVLYFSMGFGNPYGDPWNAGIVEAWTEKMSALSVETISLSDTSAQATPENISEVFAALVSKYPQIEFGAHLHTTPERWREKIEAAWNNGCTRFDGALKGYGGCPMASDVLTGNMPTENMLQFFSDKNIALGLDGKAFQNAMQVAGDVFASE